MKNLLSALTVLILLPLSVMGQQNHVPNCSFENFITCPTAVGQVNNCSGWRPYTSATPDYLHGCNTTWANGFLTTSPPAHGQAYMQLAPYTDINVLSHFEYIASEVQPLQAGKLYEVSMSVQCVKAAGVATNNLGVFFYDSGPNTVTQNSMLSHTSQIHYANYGTIKNQTTWVRLTQVFVPDSAYDNIVIGGFKNPKNDFRIDTIGINSFHYSFYLIDSVVIKLADSLHLLPVDTMFCAGDTLSIKYNSWVKKKSTNTFTIQLSNSVGSFANPVNIGSIQNDSSGSIKCTIPSNTPTGTGYRIRIIASDYKDTADLVQNIYIGNMAISKPVANNNSAICVNDTLQLNAYSSTIGVSYRWNGPLNYYSNLQDPVINKIKITEAGEYVVTAYIYGCLAKDTTTVLIIDDTKKRGTYINGADSVCMGDTIKLSAPVNPNVTYKWSGPNGFSSTSRTPIIPAPDFTFTGYYSLVMSNGKCSTKDSILVIIKPFPAGFNAGANLPICSGQTLQLTATSTSGDVTYKWVGPNSYHANGSTQNIGAASSIHNGNYIATATLKGCSINDTVVVSIKPSPTTPTISNNGPICEGETLNLSGSTTTNGVTYSWSGPNSYSSTTQNPSITNTTTATSGNYIVTATLDGCNTSATTTVLVKPIPVAVTVSSNSPVCEGSTLQLNSTASATTGVTYSWTGPNSFTATTQNSSVIGTTPAATGRYRLNVELNGCTYKDSLDAIVNVIPAAPAITYNSPLCISETLTLNGGNINGAIYNWTGPGNYSSTQAIAIRTNMQAADAGTYKARVTVNGCTSAEGAANVNLNPVPFVVILANPADSICQGDIAMFTAIPSNHSGMPAYQWYVNGILSANGNTYNTTTLADQDIIRCDMTESTKCSVPFKDASNDITMTVLPWLAPSVSITANPSTPLKENEYIIFTATPVHAGINPKYQWKRNGQNVIGATGNTWSANTLNDNDVITVELISDYKCPQPTTAASNSIKVRVMTGINDIIGGNGLVLYPNPNKGTFTIEGLTEEMMDADIEIVNTLGQTVYKQVIDAKGKKEINIGNLAAGFYLLKFYSEDSVEYLRFSVTK